MISQLNNTYTMESKKGMGFKAAQKKIAKKSGTSKTSMKEAGAILASSARKSNKLKNKKYAKRR